MNERLVPTSALDYAIKHTFSIVNRFLKSTYKIKAYLSLQLVYLSIFADKMAI